MKTMYQLMMAYAMMGMMLPEPYGTHKKIKQEVTPEELEEIKKIREKNVIKRKLKQGLKVWKINNIKVIALNRKNAVKKIKKIQKIINQLSK